MWCIHSNWLDFSPDPSAGLLSFFFGSWHGSFQSRLSLARWVGVHLIELFSNQFYFQDVYSIVYTNSNMTSSVEVFKCSEDTSDDGEPWRGRAVSLYQLFSLLIIPAIFTVFCYQAVIRVLWRSVRYSSVTVDILIILDAFQRCPKFDRGVSVRQQRHHPVSSLHPAPGQGIVCQVS